MLTVRWRPGDGPGDEAIGAGDALRLLEDTASDGGVWWLDVEDPTPDELGVATLITGVYGMNFRVMPELRWELGYPFAIALIVASTAALYGLFKSRGWL